MVRAWLHIDELTPEAAGGWLHTVARHLAISLYHRRRRARPAEVPIEEMPGPVVEEELDRMLDSSELQAALSRLRTNHRNVLIQLFYLQRSVAEAAAVLDIPAGTVKSRAFYALRELRTILDQRGVTKP
jgi:RNA polymerase sigma-70 factor, ECF subfamily